jgi:hypothetical protein
VHRFAPLLQRNPTAIHVFLTWESATSCLSDHDLSHPRGKLERATHVASNRQSLANFVGIATEPKSDGPMTAIEGELYFVVFRRCTQPKPKSKKYVRANGEVYVYDKLFSSGWMFPEDWNEGATMRSQHSSHLRPQASCFLLLLQIALCTRSIASC